MTTQPKSERALYQVTFVLGREKRYLEYSATDADEAYDMARQDLAARFPGASIQGKATPKLCWVDPTDDPFGEH